MTNPLNPVLRFGIFASMRNIQEVGRDRRKVAPVPHPPAALLDDHPGIRQIIRVKRVAVHDRPCGIALEPDRPGLGIDRLRRQPDRVPPGCRGAQVPAHVIQAVLDKTSQRDPAIIKGARGSRFHRRMLGKLQDLLRSFQVDDQPANMRAIPGVSAVEVDPVDRAFNLFRERIRGVGLHPGAFTRGIEDFAEFTPGHSHTPPGSALRTPKTSTCSPAPAKPRWPWRPPAHRRPDP